MSQIRLYLDEDSLKHSLVVALQNSGVDVRTALDADKISCTDEEQLIWATEQGRVLYSFNVADFWHRGGVMQELCLHGNSVTRWVSSCGDF